MIKLYSLAYPKSEFYFFWNNEHIDLVLSKINSPIHINRIWSSFHRSIFLCIDYFYKTIKYKNFYRIDLSGSFKCPFYLFVGLIQHECILHMPFWHKTNWFRFTVWLFNFYSINIFNQSLKMMVLWEWVFNNYMKNFFIPFFLKKNFFWINHPFLCHCNGPYLTFSANHIKPIFWFLWPQEARHKWFNESNQIKSFLKKNSGDVFGNREFIPVEEFYPKVDYVILSYLQNYNYLCSGVFIESIVYRKNIICFKNPICDYFFEKYWPFCYVVSSFTELEVLLLKIINYKIFYNIMFSRNLEKIAHDLTSSEFAKEQYFKNLNLKIINQRT